MLSYCKFAISNSASSIILFTVYNVIPFNFLLIFLDVIKGLSQFFLKRSDCILHNGFQNHQTLRSYFLNKKIFERNLFKIIKLCDQTGHYQLQNANIQSLLVAGY